jgi:hypothetical protein
LFSGTGLGHGSVSKNATGPQPKATPNYEKSALFTSNRKPTTSTTLTHTPEMVSLNFVQKELLEVISELEIVKMRYKCLPSNQNNLLYRYKDEGLVEQIKRLKR